MTTRKLTDKQLTMLCDFARDGEASDFGDYDGAFAWRNRERVIDSLRRLGLLDDDGITEAGRKALDREPPRRN